MDRMFDAFGLARITTAQLEDVAGLLRRLWHGEVVLGHDGPAGTGPCSPLDPDFDEHIPLLLSAFGPHSLELAGRCYDEVLLHTFFTDETLARCVAPGEERGRARRSRSGLGARVELPREPSAIGSRGRAVKKTVGRLATYLQAYGDLMVRDESLGSSPLARSAPILRRGVQGGASTRRRRRPSSSTSRR
jgi:hypothetical protein